MQVKHYRRGKQINTDPAEAQEGMDQRSGGVIGELEAQVRWEVGRGRNRQWEVESGGIREFVRDAIA
ncbi:hypothetical protein H6F51_15230 [Cyanobacteria bacterium FACHB-DQ100]|nr:hypothetical protein [Cyanobacteria bacterium FACHB-DQ100]